MTTKDFRKVIELCKVVLSRTYLLKKMNNVGLGVVLGQIGNIQLAVPDFQRCGTGNTHFEGLVVNGKTIQPLDRQFRIILAQKLYKTVS